MSKKFKYTEEKDKIIDLDTEESESDSEEEPQPKKSTKNKLTTKAKIQDPQVSHASQISTEGVKYGTDDYKKNKHILLLCDCCHLHFTKAMVKNSNFGNTCQHCYFFIHFTNPEPYYDWTLEKYIETCKKDHKYESCERRKNSNSCHICLCLEDLNKTTNNNTENKTKVETKKITFSEPEKIAVFNDDSDEECIFI